MRRVRAPRAWQRQLSGRLRRALRAAAISLAIAARGQAQGVEPAPTPDAPTAAPSRLAITVITSDSGVPTLQERVSSWFNDGTQVSVDVASELSPERLFTSSSHDVRVWIALLSPERALVVFSIA